MVIKFQAADYRGGRLEVTNKVYIGLKQTQNPIFLYSQWL